MGDVIEILTTATNTVEVEAQGPQGIPGVGVPTGGSALQVLRKKTSTDYDTEWAAAGSGSGSVTSVALASTDLTISGSPITESGTITANIAANAVTLEKLQTISSEHLLGRHGSGNGGVQQIGLGTGLAISGSNVGVTFGSSAGTACEGNDARLSDARTPSSTLAHSSSHHTGGTDVIAPNDISAAWALETRQHSFTSTSTYTLAQGRNVQLNVSIPASGATGTITLPRLTTDSAQNGDDVFIVLSGTMNGGQTLVIERYIWTGSSYTGSTETVVTTTTTGAWRFRLLSGQWVLQPVASHTHAASDITSGSFGNISHDGKIGSTSGLPVVTTTAGAVTTLALGTAGQVLTVNSGANGVEFAAAAGGDTVSINASAADVLSVSSGAISAVDATADKIVFYDDSASELTYLELGSGLSISGTTLSATATGTIGGSTGSVDNALLRADGAGGSTSQSSDLVIDDAVVPFSITGDAGTDIITAVGHNFTANQGVRFPTLTGGSGLTAATTNYFVRDISGDTFKVSTGVGGSVRDFTTNITAGTVIAMQANVAVRNNSSETNSALILTPKGTGALIFGPKPDGTSTTGNPRGAYAVDFGRVNFSAALVASGTSSAILGGENNEASGSHSCVAGGQSNTASGGRAFCAGFSNTASGIASTAAGRLNTASGNNGAAAFGMGSVADRQGMLAFSSGRPWANNAGVAQNIIHVLHGKTTTNSAVELLAGDWNEGTTRLTVPSGRVMTGLLTIVGTKSDGATVASYMRQVTIKNVGGTTSLVGTVNTVGTDEAGGTSISITANDTNDAIKVEVTGVTSEIFRWVCTANMTEMTYGT